MSDSHQLHNLKVKDIDTYFHYISHNVCIYIIKHLYVRFSFDKSYYYCISLYHRIVEKCTDTISQENAITKPTRKWRS